MDTPRSTRMAKRSQIRQQSDLSRFIMQDKENFCTYGDIAEPAQRSPLPVGYPRLPLQDITDILSPLNQMNDDEDLQGGIKAKPKARKIGSTRSCQILVEDGPCTSIQDSTLHPGVATPSRKGILTSLTNSKPRVETQAKKTVRFASTEVSEKVEICADESYEVKSVIRRPASEVAPDELSPNSQRIKRQKPPPKFTAGKNVARFR